MRVSKVCRSILTVAAATCVFLFYTASYAAECSPCDQVDACAEVDCSLNSPIDFGGWVQAGIYTNSHGWRNGLDSNGPGHTFTQRNDFSLNQLYLYAEKKLNTRRGFDFGWRAEAMFGSDAWVTADIGDDKFDAQWVSQRNSTVGYGYGLSMPQLYASIGYKDLSVKIGKFYTLLGWEAIAADQEFFYSHTFAYWNEPSTHTGVLADYQLGKRLKLSAGWTTGLSNSIENKYNDTGVITGFTFNLTDKSNVYYYTTFGEKKNFDDARGFGAGVSRRDYFKQSLVYEWLPNAKWQFVTQWDLNNDTDVGTEQHYSSYSVSQRAIYQINDLWSLGTRVEWYKDGDIYWGNDAEYVGITLGLNYNPTKSLSLRPEIRYDAVTAGKASFGGALPYGNSRSDQVSGGIAALYRF
ncbi:MAG: porin [Planctomycetaceae bacterium]|jgi:hypothetical protein|nr:porin [Planctomycetaceae bacterium]